jgi:hypothetical protein
LPGAFTFSGWNIIAEGSSIARFSAMARQATASERCGSIALGRSSLNGVAVSDRRFDTRSPSFVSFDVFTLELVSP